MLKVQAHANLLKGHAHSSSKNKDETKRREGVNKNTPTFSGHFQKRWGCPQQKYVCFFIIAVKASEQIDS